MGWSRTIIWFTVLDEDLVAPELLIAVMCCIYCSGSLVGVSRLYAFFEYVLFLVCHYVI